MKKSKDVKLYSAFFPFYGFILAYYKDFLWMIPANLVLTALVILCVLLCAKIQDKKNLLKQTYGKALGTAVLADLVALFVRYLPLLAEKLCWAVGANAAAGYLANYWSDFTWYEIWAWWNPIGLPWTILCIACAAVFAGLFNYFVALKKVVPDKKLRLALSIVLGIFSAPYTWTNPAW